jgi:hypothetical protein
MMVMLNKSQDLHSRSLSISYREVLDREKRGGGAHDSNEK